MLLREFKDHFKRGDLESAIAVTSPNNDGYYLMVRSSKWGVNSFLESDRKMQPRMFKTKMALLNAANSIGFTYQSIDVTQL
ncbi:hypothetical protein AB4354_21630 [Vibrio splendidus]|jgi:hypothetical protein|uniref:Uncharacterized protein n=1 Tax=Vibrio splendidus TaxID=29497 RepID=A0A2N7F545_VIBSP|nr:hypothetical protein [Vibrio splendidus]OMO25689.1 hypothetical protein BH581_14785 [Vibrio splendidus]PMG37284.1 hypothetical protein BCU97_01260 [Vibrio splendidus]PMH04415.1 hypothetical protein BCU75_23270 [Vibrio splendidus]PMJ60783.1 hypothetical protein BCU17_06415 [Vibrio splendidus]PMJ95429.1 hypothetical protein BCU10_07330 [Vibrio splendidus]